MSFSLLLHLLLDRRRRLGTLNSGAEGSFVISAVLFKDPLLHGLSRLASGVRSIPLPHVEFDHHMHRDEKMPFLTTKYIVLDAYLSNTCLSLSILEK